MNYYQFIVIVTGLFIVAAVNGKDSPTTTSDGDLADFEFEDYYNEETTTVVSTIKRILEDHVSLSSFDLSDDADESAAGGTLNAFEEK